MKPQKYTITLKGDIEVSAPSKQFAKANAQGYQSHTRGLENSKVLKVTRQGGGAGLPCRHELARQRLREKRAQEKEKK